MVSFARRTDSYSVSTYQNLDGSNYTIAAVEEKYKGESSYISGSLGVGTDFKKTFDGVLDLKAGLNYDKKGIINQNIRVRTKLGTNAQSIQIRYSPLSVNVPVGEKTTLYANPHYTGQMNFMTNKWTNSLGIFAGATQQISKDVSVSLEAQRYNLQKPKANGPENWGINAIISCKF